MTNHRKAIPAPPIILDAAAPLALHRQLYEALRNTILSGELGSGYVLPSTRALARHLGVSRTTVVTAYEQLVAEGYLESKVGAGTFVTDSLPERYLAVRAQPISRTEPESTGRAVSQRAERFNMRGFQPITDPIRERLPGAFPVGIPALDAFPLVEWQRLVNRAYRTVRLEQLAPGDPRGDQPLREAISSYLNLSRAVRCSPAQVIITSGAQQALHLSAQLLLDVGDTAWIEDPGYVGARRALAGAGASLVPVPIDEEGIDVAAGIEVCAEARLAYVTPSHQFPLGVTMKLSRRLALLEWAQKAQGWIVEDDYDSELCFTGHPLPALQGLDTNERVIYIGTFNKVLFPALRLGYVVVPPDLIEVFTRAYTAMSGAAPIVEQKALAQFIESGGFERHLRRMRTLYAERQATFLACAEQLGAFCTIQPTEAGMHLVGKLASGLADYRLAQQAARYGVMIPPLSAFSLRTDRPHGLLFGYAAADGPTTREGLSRLAEAFSTLGPL